jgi:hypothetical protein
MVGDKALPLGTGSANRSPELASASSIRCSPRFGQGACRWRADATVPRSEHRHAVRAHVARSSRHSSTSTATTAQIVVRSWYFPATSTLSLVPWITGATSPSSWKALLRPLSWLARLGYSFESPTASQHHRVRLGWRSAP